MNRTVLDYLERRIADDRDYEDGRRRRNPRTGRYMRDRRDYDDYDDYDYRRDRRDYDDYDDESHERRRREMRLSKADINHWKKKLQNTDGTKGEHYDYNQVMDIAEKMNIKFDKFDEKEFCMAINMLYSDYAHVVRKYVSQEKELHFFAELAKAFLDDPDGPESSEKLALYYHCIASYV